MGSRPVHIGYGNLPFFSVTLGIESPWVTTIAKKLIVRSCVVAMEGWLEKREKEKCKARKALGRIPLRKSEKWKLV